MKNFLYIIVISFLFQGCSGSKNVIYQDCDEEVEVIEEIFSFLTLNKFGYHLAKFQDANCTKIYPRFTAVELSAYYNIWHYHLLKQRDNSKWNYLFGEIKDPLMSLDTIDLKSKILFESDIKKVKEIDNQCVEFFDNGSNLGVLYFSPLIKMNKKGHYHVALKLMDNNENPEFLFIMKINKKGTFEVVHYIWGDYWPTIGIGDEFDVLKSK